jgi:Kef-type K+ transport system membrane component KefB/mannitol/fructose-specific phosphotransferase system IIA component (Ntr-type)
LKKFKLLVLLLFISGISYIYGNDGVSTSLVERMPNLVIQLGIIIFAARFGAIFVEKIGVPGVLGELMIGVIIGPYLLGGIPLPGFEHGLFANVGSSFPIQPELYGIAIIASIILLFLSGLETDLKLLIRFSLAGVVVGIGGVLFSFFIGAFTAMFFMHLPLSDPKCLFMGIMSTATSVGITARILSERKKMDTPEGVTILAGAVFDDVLGIILLAIVLGMSVAMKANKAGTLNWPQIGLIAFKEISIWLGVTLVGLYFAKKIGGFLKSFKNRYVFSVMAFSIALIISGLFEKVGLAMIIGAYVVGLTLSRTDISSSIREAMNPLHTFFVPIFFVVMGMLVDFKALLNPATLVFGVVYTLGALISKFVGCGVPSLFFNFNWQGAKRIGLGMIPRGEVALIIAGIGLSYGFLSDPTYNIFGIAIMMTLITTLISPPLLNHELKKAGRGVHKSLKLPEKEILHYQLNDTELTELMSHKVILQFQSMGFYVNKLDPDIKLFSLSRSNTSITLKQEPHGIALETDKEDSIFVQRMVHEAAFYLKQSVSSILNMDVLLAPMEEAVSAKETANELEHLLKTENIIPNLKFETKEGIVWELVESLFESKRIPQIKSIYYSVMARENYLSGGLVNGLAIPHAHTDEVAEPLIALGIKKNGVNFDSIDKKPTSIIILILTPESASSIHIRLLANLSRLGRQPHKIKEIVELTDPKLIKSQILSAISYTDTLPD